MKVGWVGLGKLGLPCAAALAAHHEVIGVDTDFGSVLRRIADPPAWEEGLAEALEAGRARFDYHPHFAPLVDADVVLVAVPTPHRPDLDGTWPPGSKADFGYEAVLEAFVSLSEFVRPGTPVALVSTVAPGTAARLDFAGRVPGPFVYHPFLIAMGTTISDFLHPEFRIMGIPDRSLTDEILDRFLALYDPLDPGAARLRWMRVAEAEVLKMVYNTFIGLKIGFANTVAELCDGVGADADEVLRVLRDATDRVNSWKYLRPGMGDGGACHPRDQIVLDFVAARHGHFPNFFDAAMSQRYEHLGWLARIVAGAHAAAEDDDRPLVVLGYAYKADSGLSYGSPALLLARELEDLGPRVIDANFGDEEKISVPSTVFVGADHIRYRFLELPAGSTVVDPFGIVPQDSLRAAGVDVVLPGRRPEAPQWPV